MAFGTGTHPTTTLCLKAIEDYVKEGHQVFDIGTGSGILAVAAAKLGADVQAGDIDTMAVRIAKENADLNGVAEKVQVQAGNLGEVFTGKADIVIANIIADVIVDLLPELYTIMKPNGVFLACGIIEKRADDVLQKIEETGLDTIETREEDGWILISSKWALS
jgi:ribosomal protein L11 methyltransferase